jgi:hypothetical protein
MGVQDNLSAPTGSLTEQSEPTEGKPRITSIRPEKVHQSNSANMKNAGGQVVRVWWAEDQGGWERSPVCGSWAYSRG